MKLTKKEQIVAFGNLCVGDTFKYCGTVGIKVAPNINSSVDTTYNYVELETGTLYLLENWNKVQMLNVEIKYI